MVGVYADVPDLRMAYDRDGTVGFSIKSGVVASLSSGTLVTWNDEANTWFPDVFYQGDGTVYYGIIFPEKRDILGYFAMITRDGFTTVGNIETSVDTTNGLDGTWVSRGDFSFVTVYAPTVVPSYRTSINAVSWSGIKGVRWYGTSTSGTRGLSLHAWHFYGKPSSGENPDRLRFWHPTLNQEVSGAYFDWGDSPQGITPSTKQFRIKNNSGSLTAISIGLSSEALVDGSPSLPGETLFSLDNITYATTLNIGNLAPGAISAIIYIKVVISSVQSLSLWSWRALAIAGSWA